MAYWREDTPYDREETPEYQEQKLYEWLYFDEDKKVMYSSSGEQACKYEDQTLKIRLEFPKTTDGKFERDLLLDNLFPRKENEFYKGDNK